MDASQSASRPGVLANPLVVGALAGIVGVVISLVVPPDLPFQPSSLILFPMLAVAGPIGGAIGGAISGFGTPIFFVAIPSGLVGGLLLGWGYRRFVSPQGSTVGRLAAWALLVLVVDAVSSLLFATVLPMLDSTMPGFPESIGVMIGFAAPSTAFDLVATTIVMAILPAGLRRPLS